MPPLFVEKDPELESYWRAAILLGRNSASFKFALGEAILKLAGGNSDFVSLEDLAIPYSQALRTHLANADRQGTSARSRFLDALRAANRGEISEAQAVEETVRRGFANVLDAFHVVHGEDMSVAFFVDERASRVPGVRLTDATATLARDLSGALPDELEARWRLVESAWALDLPTHLIEYDEAAAQFVAAYPDAARRPAITRARAALNGYQKGHCFYCSRGISIDSSSSDVCDVDHLLPRSLGLRGFFLSPDGIWNLVLACRDCNRGERGKGSRIPARRYVERLYLRNEWLIRSYLPLRETLIAQLGRTPAERRSFLRRSWEACFPAVAKPWEVPDLERPRI